MCANKTCWSMLPYKCKECNGTSGSKINLKQHMLVHKGDKPYKCTVCDGTFSSASFLRQNKLVHTSNKHNACNNCVITTKSKLQAHVRVLYVINYIHGRYVIEHSCEVAIWNNTFSSTQVINHINVQYVLEWSHLLIVFDCTRLSGDTRFSSMLHNEWLSTNGFILGINHTRVHFVRKIFQKEVTWKNNMLIHTGNIEPFPCILFE